MKTAVLVKSALRHLKSDARLYRLSEPISYGNGETTDHVVVSAVNAFGTGPETYIFPSSCKGEILDWLELEGSFRGCFDHERALRGAGYEVFGS